MDTNTAVVEEVAPPYKKRERTDYIVVHCSDTFPHQDIGAKEIRQWHMKERGWIDIGYHYVIRRDGTVEVGRPEDVIGAHVVGYNAISVAVCLVGGRAPEGPKDNFTAEQWEALSILLANLRIAYRGAEPRGHRDFPGVKKACPCFDVRKWWYGILE